MLTSEEIRRKNLIFLAKTMGGMATLNRKVGRGDRDNTLSQIANASPDSKTGKEKGMGGKIARDLEVALNLERGYMDHDHDSIEWPFLTISPKRFKQLEVHQLNAVEESMGRLLDAILGPEVFAVEKRDVA